jgi:hypothetical protein
VICRALKIKDKTLSIFNAPLNISRYSVYITVGSFKAVLGHWVKTEQVKNLKGDELC